MDELSSDKEQIESLKRWIQENWLSIALGVSLGLGGVYGWRGWQDWRVRQAEMASAEFSLLMEEANAASYEKVSARANRIVSEYNSTAYAQMATLILARVFAEQGKYSEAAGVLRTVIDKPEIPQLAHVARLRLARVLVSAGMTDEAMGILAVSDQGGFSAAYEEVRGDIFVAQKNHDQARVAYQKALSLRSSGGDTGVLQMKLDDLGHTESKP
ncbi:MAG: tetratricopeptide repeat protein [Gammaproteobacteria bacterium]|nr:MAG: tetratricopeptide repeat protein [Gammaproteobacteria bacterium]